MFWQTITAKCRWVSLMNHNFSPVRQKHSEFCPVLTGSLICCHPLIHTQCHHSACEERQGSESGSGEISADTYLVIALQVQFHVNFQTCLQLWTLPGIPTRLKPLPAPLNKILYLVIINYSSFSPYHSLLTDMWASSLVPYNLNAFESKGS